MLVLIAIFAPLLAPHDPIEQSTINRLEPPSPEYPLGRDDFGRDVLSRIIYGTRVALTVGVLSVLLGAADRDHRSGRRPGTSGAGPSRS